MLLNVSAKSNAYLQKGLPFLNVRDLKFAHVYTKYVFVPLALTEYSSHFNKNFRMD